MGTISTEQTGPLMRNCKVPGENKQSPQRTFSRERESRARSPSKDDKERKRGGKRRGTMGPGCSFTHEDQRWWPAGRGKNGQGFRSSSTLGRPSTPYFSNSTRPGKQRAHFVMQNGGGGEGRVKGGGTGGEVKELIGHREGKGEIQEREFAQQVHAKDCRSAGKE